MRYGYQKRERVGLWFEGGLVFVGIGLVLLDLFSHADGALLFGALILFVWTFIVGQRNGLRLQEEEKKYLKSLRQEDERRADTAHLVRITMLASTPLYLGMAFPIMLMPYGGLYALAFFVPMIGVSLLRMNIFYQRWKLLEVKPNFYWWMQLGVCLGMVGISFLMFLFGVGK